MSLHVVVSAERRRGLRHRVGQVREHPPVHDVPLAQRHGGRRDVKVAEVHGQEPAHVPQLDREFAAGPDVLLVVPQVGADAALGGPQPHRVRAVLAHHVVGHVAVVAVRPCRFVEIALGQLLALLAQPPAGDQRGAPRHPAEQQLGLHY